jgi:hypothetical protein
MSNNDDFNRAVQAAAEAQVQARQTYKDTADVRDAGLSQFPDFQQSLATLQVLGVTDLNVVSDLIALDKANAHVVLDQLAKDPEKAAQLADMDPRRRISEFTRMADAAARPKVPATPTPPRRAKHWLESDDEKQVTENFHAMLKRRSERR